ncbi:MAG: hypothetical protein CME36_09625 [unclassified Hahellaceae]|nr:hypothetical protein [Hahellaceae bacterium]|tara:strand:+ start:27291 stop:27626 length:336 start_codon:yes stop_codon:yes gene_type:complete
MKAIYAPFLLCLMLMLGACSLMPPEPRTFNQSNAVATQMVTNLGVAIYEGFKAGYITPEKADALKTQLLLVTDMLNTANDIAAAQPEMAAENLERALRMLEQLQIELEAQR